ncbi:S8 family peptidase [Ferruginibacter sp. SUN106]|uniref:S8 family peptidase n=1 Tax=Ferruginibacter sp. SUN106 TaxID=2978348 RepID=UPI003D365918
MHKFLIVFVIGTLSFSISKAQKESTPNGWHLMDKDSTGYYGVSANKAYSFIKSKNLKSKTVIVAVIDSGIDTLHEDLKPILWTNPKEIPGNGIDDDHNGYIDDVHGWNFLGGKDGRNVKEDSYEAARVYHDLKSKYEGKEKGDIAPKDLAEFTMWQKAKANITGEGKEDAGIDIVILKRLLANMQKSDSTLKVALAKEVFTGTELNSFIPTEPAQKTSKNALLGLMKANNQLEATNKEFMEGFAEYVAGEDKKEESKNTPPPTYRADIVKDDETNINDRFYGNNDIMASTPMHGTHCSGIIAAVRNNGKGMDGIADNVRIMMVRAVPDGDEHDKDIANAIRYAVDNGAQVISMSFGKDFSPQKQWVDDAFRYAESKNVLLVHAAGNDAKDVDTEDNFPSPVYINGKGRAGNVVTVGASGDPKNGGLTASFSNYGKKEVDVFSPGVKIYATLPGGNTYGNLQGTSMACPLVAGIAALTLEYFPNLSAKQLKYVLENSTQKPDFKVSKPGTEDMVNLSDISKSGGIVNAYAALKLASTLKGERKIQKEVLPKPKLVKTKKG